MANYVKARNDRTKQNVKRRHCVKKKRRNDKLYYKYSKIVKWKLQNRYVQKGTSTWNFANNLGSIIQQNIMIVKPKSPFENKKSKIQ